MPGAGKTHIKQHHNCSWRCNCVRYRDLAQMLHTCFLSVNDDLPSLDLSSLTALLPPLPCKRLVDRSHDTCAETFKTIPDPDLKPNRISPPLSSNMNDWETVPITVEPNEAKIVFYCIKYSALCTFLNTSRSVLLGIKTWARSATGLVPNKTTYECFKCFKTFA